MVGSTCDWGWQTYAWSGGKVSGKAHIYQYHNGVPFDGADCDLNRSLQSEIGAWKPMADPDYRPYGPPKRDVGGRTATR